MSPSDPIIDKPGAPRNKDANDTLFMHAALDLARAGIALTSPNPAVGAVIVDAAGNIIGRGSHTYDGVKHAEVLALEDAGSRARGATLYLNLEPCSQQGRTGPCADAIIAAGLKRVVVAMRDPNPQEGGRSLAKLRAVGIDVTEDVLHEPAAHLNEAFARYIRTALPLVTLKAGMTLDGKIAPPPGHSDHPTALGAGGATGGWITSVEARAHVQELRHASDAIMVGVGTVVADDPLLTDRTGLPRRRPLLRVILDSRLRMPLDSRLAKTCRDDVLVLCSFAEEKKRRELEQHGIRVEQVSLAKTDRISLPGRPIPSDGRPDMAVIAARLGEMQITSLLIEGGALVNWAAIAARIVDKVFLYYAPKILAGTGSVPFAAGPGFRDIDEAAQVKRIRIHRFGEDFAVEGYLRDPYADHADIPLSALRESTVPAPDAGWAGAVRADPSAGVATLPTSIHSKAGDADARKSPTRPSNVVNPGKHDPSRDSTSTSPPARDSKARNSKPRDLKPRDSKARNFKGRNSDAASERAGSGDPDPHEPDGAA